MFITIGGKLVDLSGKIPLTRGRHYDSNGKRWDATSIERDWHKKFDILIFYCVSKDGGNRENIYISYIWNWKI